MNKPKLIFTLALAICCSSLSAQETDLDSLDSDSNGKVTVAEFKDYAGEKLPGFEKLDDFAKLVDVDNDGEISADEFEDRMGKLQPLMANENSPEEAPPAKEETKKASTEEQKAANKEVRETFAKIKSHIKKHDWESAAKLMTDGAADRAVANQVVMSLGMLDMELPPGIGDFEDAIDNIDSVVDKYDLDSLDIDPQSSMMMSMGEGDDSKANKTNVKILAALDKNGKRWEICSELSKALSASPFAMNPLTGSVEDVVLNDGKAIVEISLKPDEMEKQGGVQIQIMAPPMFYNFVKHDGAWKNDGLNQKETSAAMKEFREDMPGMSFDGEGPDIKDMKPRGTIEAPSFSGKTLDGKDFSLTDLKGKLVLVDFWGTWCPPCVAELPQLKKFHEEFKKHGFEVVGVASDDVDTLKEFSKDKTELTWTNVVDEDGEISDKFGINAFPTSLLIDQDGKHIDTDISKKELLGEIIERLKLDKADYEDFLKKPKKKKSDSEKD